MLRHHLRFFSLTALASLGLRLLFFFFFPSVTDDSRIYGDIATNWLKAGTFGLSEMGKVVPTYIRLPGYPAFLAAVFSLFGLGHYRTVLLLQIIIDLASCLVIADMARRVFDARAAKAAFLLAGLCPFLANYSAAALTETLEVFFTVLALDFAFAGLERLGSGDRPWRASRPWGGCGLAVSATLLLRPDGGILLTALALGFLWLFIQAWRAKAAPMKAYAWQVARAGLVTVFLSLLPLAPWTLRNWHTLHQFEPLAPRYANEPGEFVPMGFNHWVKTWIIDYVSVEEIYWSVPNDQMDAGKLPARAFDSPEQLDQTRRLLADYNPVLYISPALDARFESLAQERIRAAPIRYYMGLPLARIADMWLRPRTELLPADTRWWEFNDDPEWSVVAVGFLGLGVLYVLAAFAGLARSQLTAPLALLIGFVVLRSAFLGSLENPEPRYTLECYPAIIVLAAAMFQGLPRFRREPGKPS